MYKNIKWTEIIKDESEITKVSALYIIPVNLDQCRVIFIDDFGNKRELSAGAGTDKNFLHIQSTASTEWTINHGLGKRPTPSFHFPSGKPMGSVDYEHISNSQMKAYFSNPEIGSVTLN